MEKEMFPEVKIVDFQALRERAGAFLKGVWNAGHVTELCLTEHKRGAAEMLDQHLDIPVVQPELPFPAYEPLPIIERTDAGQLTSRWDDMGNYYYEH